MFCFVVWLFSFSVIILRSIFAVLSVSNLLSLLLSSIPLYWCITICLSLHLLMGIWVVFCACLVAQSCLTLWDPMDCNLPGSSAHGDFPGKNTGVGCHALIQGIFLAQGSNPGLPHCRWILYHLGHQGGPSVWAHRNKTAMSSMHKSLSGNMFPYFLDI